MAELVIKASESNDREYERGLQSCVANNELASQLLLGFLNTRGSEFGGVGSVPNVAVAMEVLTKLQDQRQSTIFSAFRAFAAGKGYYIDLELLGVISV